MMSIAVDLDTTSKHALTKYQSHGSNHVDMSETSSKKRIIVCCDGTWQNSDNGHTKSADAKKSSSTQMASNVTRISRCFKRTCSDGTFQIIYYQSGVGSRSTLIDRLLGGAFGTGISENIREAYAFICANYVNGDEIVLLGFSRGAFTARSIGGMISDLGLLTRVGQEYFYPIFKDMQNWSNEGYADPFPTVPFTNKPKGTNAADIYRERLVENGYSRVRGNNGTGAPIRVLAIGVWDTERRQEEQATSDLRQVWFPGSHGNIGGGWPDQGVADTTLAWMMDQLSSVGCEFRTDALERAFETTIKYYTNREPESSSHHHKRRPPSWAKKSIYESNQPVRPWSLHYIQSATGPLSNLVGSITRAPGMYKKIDPKNGRPLPEFLEDTNERIHPSVRYWRPRRVSAQYFDPVSRRANWGPAKPPHGAETAALESEREANAPDTELSPRKSLQMLSLDPSERWVWEYVGPEITAPPVRTMVEENLGPFEQRLMHLAAGKVHVCEYAEKQDIDKLKVFELRGFVKMMQRLRRRWHRKEVAATRQARKKKTGTHETD
ncbi:hypothetical protein NPX13_g6866 [Xylaria arbuscula]|uniref:T6SS Phospholipase effector Tle1-like catalytic domain-containing protein n=1 Tax=Xylaria arbuscula TaxID=114810 RepID=A0A9W8NBE4_9PEZI|nr:hypothetical protein NPX13_g6866 [Xylaria arbuscula]